MPPLIPALIAAGGAIGGGLLGRSGSNNIAQTQQSIADQQLALTRPAYNQAYGYYSNLASGDPSAIMKAVGPSINASNLQFNQAKNNLVGSAYGLGGGLTAGLSNIEGGRAFSNSNIIGTAQAGAPAALAALASGGTSQALDALAGANQSNYASGILQQQAFGGIGSFLTRLLSGMSTGGGNPGYGNNTMPKNYFDSPIPSAVTSGGGGSYFPGMQPTANG